MRAWHRNQARCSCFAPERCLALQLPDPWANHSNATEGPDTLNRLQTELQRLDLAGSALVLELTGPGAWDALARVWHGVQADLRLPAPAIAVNGTDGYQLWFALSQPAPAAQATAFLAALRGRYLAGIAPERIRTHTPPALGVPPLEKSPGRWSAFVAPDLAAVFADDPCLDLTPGADAQADLLSRLQAIATADFERVLSGPGPFACAANVPSSGDAVGLAGAHADPRRFLEAVMNDPAVALSLRIEAAKALLQRGPG